MSGHEDDFDDTYLSEDDIYDDQGIEIEDEDDVDIDEVGSDVDVDDDDKDVIPIAPVAISNLLSSLMIFGTNVSQPIQTTPAPVFGVPSTPVNTPAMSFMSTPAFTPKFTPTFSQPLSSTSPATKSAKKDNVKFVSFTREGLSDLTAEDIKEYCRIKNIKGYSNKNKGALIDFVLGYPLNEPFSYKSAKSDVIITMNPPGVSVPATPATSALGPLITNNIPAPTGIVAPTQYTPTVFFAQATPVVAPLQQLAPAITSVVSPPVIPELQDLLEVSPIKPINEYKTAVANTIKNETENLNDQQIAIEVNKSANEQFLGSKYETAASIPTEVKSVEVNM